MVLGFEQESAGALRPSQQVLTMMEEQKGSCCPEEGLV
jgi:hypothetical protein